MVAGSDYPTYRLHPGSGELDPEHGLLGRRKGANLHGTALSIVKDATKVPLDRGMGPANSGPEMAGPGPTP
jgi:hypothetical protein